MDEQAIKRMAEVFAQWVADQVAAGRPYGEAVEAAIADMAERWPTFAAIAREAVAR